MSDRLDTQLLSRIAHEWRSAVAAASNWLQVLGKPHVDQAMRDRAVRGIAQSRDLQLELIEQLQNTILMLDGNLPLERVTVDLRQAIEGALESTLALAGQRNVTTHADLPRSESQVTGDRGRLRQALQSIVASAVKLTAAHGRVDVVLGRSDASFEIVVQSSDARLMGTALSQLLVLPEAAESPGAPPAPGLGVELPFARYVIERHGGHARVEAHGDRGIVYTLSLPAKVPAVAAGIA